MMSSAYNVIIRLDECMALWGELALVSQLHPSKSLCIVTLHRVYLDAIAIAIAMCTNEVVTKQLH